MHNENVNEEMRMDMTVLVWRRNAEELACKLFTVFPLKTCSWM